MLMTHLHGRFATRNSTAEIADSSAVALRVRDRSEWPTAAGGTRVARTTSAWTDGKSSSRNAPITYAFSTTSPAFSKCALFAFLILRVTSHILRAQCTDICLGEPSEQKRRREDAIRHFRVSEGVAFGIIIS